MADRVWVLGVPVDRVSTAEALGIIESWLNGTGPHLVFTPNAEIIARAQDNRDLKQALAQADLTVPDGIGVVLAARLLGAPVPERVPGIELLEELMARAAQRGDKVFFFGGRPGIAEEAARRLKARWPSLRVVGTQHGYFQKEEEGAILEAIDRAAPDILVVALGAPKQELWLTAHRGRLAAKVALGVGGSLDVMAGQVKRAPSAFRRLGLEWFYRLLSQPSRWRRGLQLPRFLLLVLGEILARRGTKR
ncbi:MAG: WecB/TagA/CpsF family glycosyltransferase [Firmicutes bacterium]|jgi:N-acetylglucosaminyldiphosphoundecaprenol N-acetyl-beta-D-mannosaminyltransferase|nr:WecB/TagA/CpsF family glycosyltransferase [Bacillota bacterium]